MNYDETSVILKIFDMCDYEDIIPEHPEYNQAYHEYEKLMKNISNMLTEEGQEILENLDRQHSIAASRFSEACYKKGFQTGIQVLLEGLEKVN